MEAKKKGRGKRNKRAEGDQYVYFGIHNIISFLLFFIITFNSGLLEFKNENLTYYFSWEAFLIFLKILLLMFGTSLIGRVSGYGFLYFIYRKATKGFIELNKDGINRVAMAYLLEMFLSSLALSIGLVYLIESIVAPDNESVWIIIFIYICIKISFFGYAKYKTNK